ncbi:hypothetical protein D2V17_19365 [Aurantiacibacter xanthus]|uniref:Uncharacterized protein n=1 Tax=Aurantiacibacter xanthus TaxID=1784712 RepID=A0A3A1P496_9SPHN|nr:hypothetical protein [Aurantiacibacter xanthus]RIV80474.1 hypothetical protein D2V17_19365 [Aurantiacibacter xanthus]
MTANASIAVIGNILQVGEMKGPFQSIRVAIDKEWIRVGWAGMPTLRHHLIAFAPAAILLLPAMILEQWSYALGVPTLVVGFLAYAVIIIWIHIRRMNGVGAFSTSRSERVARRSNRRRAQQRLDENKSRSEDGS